MKNNHKDILRMLAVILETHVENSQRNGVIPLLDGIEMTRLVRAIADCKMMHSPDLLRATERLRAVVDERHAPCSILAPNIHWPVLNVSSNLEKN